MPHTENSLKLLTEHELADIRKCSVEKIRKERQHGTGIPYCKDGHLVRYRAQDVQNYINSHMVVTVEM